MIEIIMTTKKSAFADFGDSTVVELEPGLSPVKEYTI